MQNVKYFIYNKYNGSTIKKSNFKKLTNLEKAEKIIRSKPIEPVVNLVPHWNEDYLQMTRDVLMKG